MKKYLFPKNDYNFLVDEIEEKVDAVGNNVYKIVAKNLPPLDGLNAAANSSGYIGNDDELRDFLESLKIDAEIEGLPEYIDPEEAVVFDTQSQSFSELSFWETTNYYSWWDGSNWKEETADDITELEISDSRVDLDEWDGSNWQTLGVGRHVEIAKILAKDGEKTNDEYLVIYKSQFEDQHTVADIVSRSDLPGILEENDRDVGEYMEQVEAL